jgi:hypothetical protein
MYSKVDMAASMSGPMALKEYVLYSVHNVQYTIVQWEIRGWRL